MEFEAYRWRNISQTSSAANRTLASIIEDRKPLVLPADETVAVACRRMWQQKVGCVLVADRLQRLKGIFTGRDAVRVLAKAKDPAATRLTKAMTHDPATMPPDNHAIDALRAMNDGGFRHLPVVANGKVLGVVSRNDFTGVEIDRLDEEEHLKECIW
ncbi:MAG: CBS domain-containing protein [Burkholderiales bacterium]|nr:CBS domain-containing protein [Burkholderiales bacterium]